MRKDLLRRHKRPQNITDRSAIRSLSPNLNVVNSKDNSHCRRATESCRERLVEVEVGIQDRTSRDADLSMSAFGLVAAVRYHLFRSQSLEDLRAQTIIGANSKSSFSPSDFEIVGKASELSKSCENPSSL